ncbi:carboxymuconolactone decarboxylase family protein [Herbidospora sp. NEAU-GS84]|uniref:Carboxymuconolactone decarboxylase family protein n=1 Tax=Herbidospora solisilvae TaxID=2696284 RepID=A0A7C9J7Z1_9ACTN|nr:carboxymuconolactone decarboxylase family protein [Herbidospora solisilvae]NAS26845.1 carboxymuconolactone decarboxylase family protein [Herbidospora solisilvae]
MNELQSRLPDPMRYFPGMGAIAAGMSKAVHNGTIPDSTVYLVHLRAGQLAGSTYHAVRQTQNLREAGETEERITAVASWRDAPCFTDAERVALELVEAVLAPRPFVPDELFARAAELYDEHALWTLTVAIGQICFFIPVALIARPIPGRPVGQNYNQVSRR